MHLSGHESYSLLEEHELLTLPKIELLEKNLFLPLFGVENFVDSFLKVSLERALFFLNTS